MDEAELSPKELEALIKDLRRDVDLGFVRLESKMDLRFAEQDKKIEKLIVEVNILKWMFGYIAVLQTGMVLKMLFS